MTDQQLTGQQLTGQQLTDQYGFVVDGSGQAIGLDLRDEVLRVSGEIDMATADELEVALASAFEPGAPLRLDLSDVPFMDSSGIRALLAASRSRDITITGASPNVRRVLTITGLLGTFHLG